MSKCLDCKIIDNIELGTTVLEYEYVMLNLFQHPAGVACMLHFGKTLK